MRVLIVDQFCGISPYELHRHPVNFEELVAQVLSTPSISYGYRAEVLEVSEDFRAQYTTTVLKADAQGNAVVHDTNWDTSG